MHLQSFLTILELSISAEGCLPFQWFISICHEFYMGKGNVHICPSYRDILLLTHQAHDLGNMLVRTQLTPHLESYMIDSMCGGVFLHRDSCFVITMSGLPRLLLNVVVCPWASYVWM